MSSTGKPPPPPPQFTSTTIIIGQVERALRCRGDRSGRVRRGQTVIGWNPVGRRAASKGSMFLTGRSSLGPSGSRGAVGEGGVGSRRKGRWGRFRAFF